MLVKSVHSRIFLSGIKSDISHSSVDFFIQDCFKAGIGNGGLNIWIARLYEAKSSDENSLLFQSKKTVLQTVRRISSVFSLVAVGDESSVETLSNVSMRDAASSAGPSAT